MATRRPTETPTDKPPAPTSAPASGTRAPRAKSAAPSAPRARKTVQKTTPLHTVNEDERRAMIAEAAYLRAEQRGFSAGGEKEDWLAAEAEVDALLKARHGGTSQ